MLQARAGFRLCWQSSALGPPCLSRIVRRDIEALIALLITMGLFNSLFGGKRGGGDGPFQTEESYAQNRARQLEMTPQTVAQLRKYDVTKESQLKLEYFFYTNTKEKAAVLAQKLTDMDYTGSYDHSASDKKQFVVTGWTSRMKMDDETVLDWTARMCDLGHEHDCEFDGWGTNPKQP